MNCVKMYKNGGYGFDQADIVQPGEGQLQIEVHSAVINPSDVLALRGKWNLPFVYPFTPGWEGSGTVSKVGAGLDEKEYVGKRVAFKLGDLQKGGAMAEYIVTDPKSVLPIGDNVDIERASSSFVNPLSALGMIDRLKELGSKATIITAAASQLGRMLIKLCLQEGIIPICTVRRDEQVQLLK